MTALDERDRLLRQAASSPELPLRQVEPRAQLPADATLSDVVHRVIIAAASSPAVT
jgi:hypothetical protein